MIRFDLKIALYLNPNKKLLLKKKKFLSMTSSEL